MNKSPIKHSLYNHILTEMLVEAREKGESSLYFEDVDKKVLQIAKAVVKWEIDEEELRLLTKVFE